MARSGLESVVGVDVEAEDGVDFDRLSAASGGAKFPARQCGEDFRGHGGRPRFEDLKIFEIAGGVQLTFDDDASAGKVFGEIGAKALGSGKSASTVRVGIGFGELHDGSADVGVNVNGVIVARKFAVEIECASGTRCGDDGDGGAGIAFDGGAHGNAGRVAIAGVKAGQIDDGAASANIDAGSGGVSGGRGTCATGAWNGRDSAPRVGIRAAGRAGFSCAGCCTGHSTSGATSVANSSAAAGATYAGFVSAGGRHGQRTFGAVAGHAGLCAGIGR